MSTLNAFPIYFGGKVYDEWTSDSLKINYSDRPFVMAVPAANGKWIARSETYPLLAAEINERRHGLKRTYFDTYASISVAIAELTDHGDAISCLPDYLSCTFSPLTLAELLRVLLDDWGVAWEAALDIISRCKFRPAEAHWPYKAEDFIPIQPRTAQLMKLIYAASAHDKAVVHCIESVLSRLILHDSAVERYRSPIGSVPSGSELHLRLMDGSGLVESATLIVQGDDYYHEQPLSSDFSCVYDVPETPLAFRYCFRLQLIDGVTCYLCEVFGKQFGRISWTDSTGFRLTVYQAGFDTPAWFRRSVMYQVFPDRFARDDSDTAEKGYAYHRSLKQNLEVSPWSKPVKWQPSPVEKDYAPNDFYGGTLKGITGKLPYLKSLGVGVLYLNPIGEAASNHRYDTSDYRRPDPILGTMEDFQTLTKEAEKLGIRVMLDGVYSHTGADSIYFNRYNSYDSVGAYNSKESPYFSWYDFSQYPEKYRSWWGFESLPEVDEENPEWQDFVITGKDSVVRHWLRNGASGWRLDVADELPDNVLALIRTAVKEESPDYVVLGEVWEDAIEKESYGKKRRYALGNALDTVMNYPFRTAVLSFLGGETTAENMADFLISQRLHYPKPMYYALMNLLSSHDVPRIRTMLAIAPEKMPGDRSSQAARKISPKEDARGAALQRLAAAISFCIPGIPSVYYGDETGMNGFTDPFNRAPFSQGDFPLTEWYTGLGKLRSEIPALSTGGMGAYAGSSDLVLILRTISGGKDAFGQPAEDGTYVLAVNRSGRLVQERVSLMESGHGLEETELVALRSAGYTSGAPLMGDGRLHLKGGIAEVVLPAQTACIFKLQ